METHPATPPKTLDPADLFGFLVGVVCGVVEWCALKHGVAEPLALRVWRRVNRLGARFAELAEQIRTGTLPEIAPPRPRGAAPPPEAEPDASQLGPSRAVSVVRRQRGWLRYLIPELEGSRDIMDWLFLRPEMRALIAAAPLHVGRIIRPLCWMLGADLPTALRLRLPEWARNMEPFEPAPAPAPVPPQPADDDGMSPQWREPEPLAEPHEENWKLDPPERPPKNRE